MYNGIERESDLGLNWDMAMFRSYDPSIGRWAQVDPLAEIAPELTPYRFGFNNPILFTDSDGLFETKKAAKEYAKKNKIRTGWFSRNKIKKQKDGTYAIENRKEHTSTSDLGTVEGVELGVMTSSVVKANDVMDINHEANTMTYRDGAVDALTYDCGDCAENQPKGGSIAFGPGGTFKGLLSFRGLIQNRALRNLTHQNLMNAFKNTGFKLSNHAVKRLKDIRTEKLGFKTLNDVKNIFNKGTFFKAKNGLVGKSYKGMEVIYNPQTKVIVTVRPAKVR